MPLTPTVEERFWSYVAVGTDDECWPWTGALGGRCAYRYGQMRVAGSCAYAHRLSYTLAHGPIEPGLVIDQLCRNTRCVNPSHLEAVTQRDNLLRGKTITARNAAVTQCPAGHSYTGTNTYMDGNKRVCRTCKRDRNRNRLAARKASPCL
jgi:hypothetical protein